MSSAQLDGEQLIRVPRGDVRLVQSEMIIERSESQVVYAIVRAGGRQEKVSVGDLVTVDRVPGAAGSTIKLPAVMLVDGDKVTTAADELAKVSVEAEVLENIRGKKIVIEKFKNKTGYRKRQGHRSELTRIKVTSIA